MDKDKKQDICYSSTQTHLGIGDTVGGNKYIGDTTNIYPTRVTKCDLKKTINKLFKLNLSIDTSPINTSVEFLKKIDINKIGKKWIERINAIAGQYKDIENCCDSDSSDGYSTTDLVKIFKHTYKKRFQDYYKEEKINADDVLTGIVNHFMNEIQKHSSWDAHDELVLEIITAYVFLECGILEKK